MGKRSQGPVVAFVGDTHVGSEVALWPDHFKTNRDRPVPMSSGQHEILQYFEDFVDKCDKHKVDIVVFMGDLIDGCNPAESGRHRMVPDMNIQADACVEVLTPLVKLATTKKGEPRPGRKILAVSGTIYHDAKNGKIEREVVNRMGGTWLGAIRNIKLGSSVVQVKHGVGSSPMYSGTAACKAMMLWRGAVVAKGLPHVDLMAQGHWHHYLYVDEGDMAFLQVPCWQDYMPYRGTLAYVGKNIPVFGAVIVDFGGSRPHVKPYKYPGPQITMRVKEIE